MEIKLLQCGDWSAQVCVARGANCISLRHAGYGMRVLREPDYEKGIDNPFLYGMPILFPVNRISGGVFRFEGREYCFPINEPETNCHLHGVLHELPFTVLEESESHLRCFFEPRGEMPGFPHDFSITLAYTLTNEGLELVTEVENRSGQNMPILLGFHTTFDLNGISSGKIAVGAEVGAYAERDARYLPTGRLLPSDEITRALQMSDFNPRLKPISRHYKADGAGRITLHDRERGIKVLYENSADFGWRLIYNGAADSFICLEPQTAAVDAANALYPNGLAEVPFIPPHQTAIYHSKIQVYEGEKI